MTQAVGFGRDRVLPDSAGQVFPANVPHGTAILVREHQFWPATRTSATTSSGWRRGLDAVRRPGLLAGPLRGAPGRRAALAARARNAFEVVLQPGEVIDVEPGLVIYRDNERPVLAEGLRLKTASWAAAGTWCSTVHRPRPGRPAVRLLHRAPRPAPRWARWPEERGGPGRGGGRRHHRRPARRRGLIRPLRKQAVSKEGCLRSRQWAARLRMSGGPLVSVKLAVSRGCAC